MKHQENQGNPRKKGGKKTRKAKKIKEKPRKKQ